MPRPWTETRARHGPRARGRLRRVTAPPLACGPSYRTSRGFRPRWLHVAPSAAPPSPRYFIPCRNALGSPLSSQRRPQNQKRGPRPHPHSGGRPRAPLPSATLVGCRRPRIGEPGREALPTRRTRRFPGRKRPPAPAGRRRDPSLPRGPPTPGPGCGRHAEAGARDRPGNTLRRGPGLGEVSVRPSGAVRCRPRAPRVSPRDSRASHLTRLRDGNQGRSRTTSDRCPPAQTRATCFPATDCTRAGHADGRLPEPREEGRPGHDGAFLPLSLGCGGFQAELCPPEVPSDSPDPDPGASARACVCTGTSRGCGGARIRAPVSSSVGDG